MPYSRFIDNSRPSPYTKDYVYDGIRFTHMRFQPGEWMTVEYVGSGLMSEMASQHIQPTGYRKTVEGTLPDMAAGSMTRRDDYPVTPQQNKREAIIETDLWCCKIDGSDEARTDHVSSVRLDVGDALEVETGGRVFVIHGQVAVGDFTFAAPQLLIASAPRVIAPVGGTAYLFKWAKP